MAFAKDQPQFAPEELQGESDEVLMVRVCEGDVAAYEAIYSRYKNRILTFVHRYLGDRDWAEDLTQEVFLKVYRNPQAFDPRSRFLTWLFTVARNLTIDFMRRKKPSASLTAYKDGGEVTLEPVMDGEEGPVQLALVKEMEENLQEMLGSLSDKLREVFILCAMHGMSYEEVAQVVGCPAKTVSSRLSRARERFMKGFNSYLSGRKTS